MGGHFLYSYPPVLCWQFNCGLSENPHCNTPGQMYLLLIYWQNIYKGKSTPKLRKSIPDPRNAYLLIHFSNSSESFTMTVMQGILLSGCTNSVIKW